MTSASARGLATITHDGTVLDVWFPAVSLDTPVSAAGTERLEETPQQFAALVGPDEERGVARVAVETSIADLDAAPIDAYDAYLRLPSFPPCGQAPRTQHGRHLRPLG